MNATTNATTATARDKRKERLMPGGVPRWIRVYDNGGEPEDCRKLVVHDYREIWGLS